MAAGLVLIAWGSFGFFDRLQQGRGGFTYMPDYVVNFVEPNGAAEKAGLLLGDRVVRVEGAAVEDLPLYSRWPRALSPGAGESLNMVVRRDGEIVSLDLVYGPTPLGVINLRLGVAVIGLAFLLFCLWPIVTVRTPHALALARIGLVAGLATFGMGPYLGTWDGIASHVQVASMFLLVVLMLQFFLRFPEPKPIGVKRVSQWLIFGPWVLFVGCLVLELVFHPRLYHTFGGAGMMLLLAYGALTLVAVGYSLLKIPMRELWASGMGWILLGLLVAMGPSLMVFLAMLMIPGLWLPGVSYFQLLLMAIPLSMALAVRRQARSAC